MSLRIRGLLPLCAVCIAAAIAQAQAPPHAQTQPSSGYAAAIGRINYYRAMMKLPLARFDPDLSKGAELHARYLVENHVAAADGELASSGAVVEKVWSEDPHRESRDKPLFSEQGAKVARDSVIIHASRMPEPAEAEAYIDQLATKPFDSLITLNPQVVLLGIGSRCGAAGCIIVMTGKAGLSEAQFADFYHAGLDVLWYRSAKGHVLFTQRELRQAIEFPPPGATVPLGTFDGSSYPRALEACPGYRPPTGRPIYVALGAPSSSEDKVVRIGDFSIASDGEALEACGVDAKSFSDWAASNYRSHLPDDKMEAVTEAVMASQVLARTGAVLVIPREPLAPGKEYQVSITADQRNFQWSFRIGPALSSTPDGGKSIGSGSAAAR